jgi:hypothetical protein
MHNPHRRVRITPNRRLREQPHSIALHHLTIINSGICTLKTCKTAHVPAGPLLENNLFCISFLCLMIGSWSLSIASSLSRVGGGGVVVVVVVVVVCPSSLIHRKERQSHSFREIRFQPDAVG